MGKYPSSSSRHFALPVSIKEELYDDDGDEKVFAKGLTAQQQQQHWQQLGGSPLAPTTDRSPLLPFTIIAAFCCS